MPRQRFIHPEFFEDPVTAKQLNPLQRLFFLGCVSAADDEGRLVAEPAALRNYVFRYDDMSLAEVQQLRDAMCAICRNVILYSVDDVHYIAFAKWTEWQHPRYLKPSRHPAPPEETEKKKESTLDTDFAPVLHGSCTDFAPVLHGSCRMGWEGMGRDGMGREDLRPACNQPEGETEEVRLLAITRVADSYFPLQINSVIHARLKKLVCDGWETGAVDAAMQEARKTGDNDRGKWDEFWRLTYRASECSVKTLAEWKSWLNAKNAPKPSRQGGDVPFVPEKTKPIHQTEEDRAWTEKIRRDYAARQADDQPP